MDMQTQQGGRLQAQAWAIPAPGVTVEDLLTEFAANGTPVLRVEDGKVLVLDVDQEGLLG